MIVVDAGHGGVDPGASGYDIVEKEYNLKIANYIFNRLKELGANVKSVRTTDETISPEVRTQRILNAFGNRPDVVVLSNHLNAGGGTGAEVVYALRNRDTLSKLILEELAKEGQSIRKWYQRRLPSDPSKDYYFIHRDTGVTEPVLIEYAFVDNAQDANAIKTRWQDFAEAVVRAVSIYIKIPYTGVTNGDVYVVRSGDSLYSIAKKYNVSVDALKAENNLTSNLLSLGQTLKIPGFVPSDGANITYVVKSGDSLYIIANKYNTTVDELKRVNNLTTNTLSIGQILSIPSAITPTLPGTQPYIVKSGDSLWSIANNYDTTVDELKRLNNLATNTLSIGQVLKVPATNGSTLPSNTYVVKAGDSLWSISNNFNVPVTTIRSLNNLTSDLLSVGQTLVLPSLSQDTQVYVVQRGDSLYSIANRYNTTVNEIKALNNLATNILDIGQELKLPI